MEKVPSLNVRAFIAAYERYIVSQPDILAVAKHILGKADEKTTFAISEVFQNLERHKICLKIQDKLYAWVIGDDKLTHMISDSVFTDAQAALGCVLSVEYDNYYISFWAERIARKVYVCKDNLTFCIDGTSDAPVFTRGEEEIVNPFSADLYRYIVLLWNYSTECHTPIEDDAINYDALRNLL